MSKLLACGLTFFLLCCSFSFSFCQDFPMQHFTVEDGLPSNVVYYIYRDSKGYLWIGTDKGVARYNGLKFETFTTFNGLSDNEIFFFQEDAYGRLWLGTYNGELCYYKNGVFHTAENTPFLKLPFKASHIGIISAEADSSIIIGFQDHTRFVDIHNEDSKVFSLENINRPGIIHNLVYRKKINQAEYMVICANKIIVIDTSYKVIHEKDLDEEYQHTRYTSCQNQHYIFNRWYIFNTNMQIIKKIPSNFNKTATIYEIYINNNDVFYATNNGIYINDTLNILKGHKASAITQDNGGNYWVSTLNDGIYEISKGFTNTSLYENADKSPAAYAYADSKHLFFSTTNNNLYSLEKNRIHCLLNYEKLRKGMARSGITEPGYFIDTKYHYYNFYGNDIITIDNLLSSRLKINIANNTRDVSGMKGFFLLDSTIFIKRANIISKLKKLKLGVNSLFSTEHILNTSNNERIFGMAISPDNKIWYSTINYVYKLRNDTPVFQLQFRKLTFKSFDFISHYLVGYTHGNRLLVCDNYNQNVSIDTIAPQNCIWDKFYKIDSCHLLISTNNLYRIITINPPDSVKKISIQTVENSFIPLRAETICSDGKNCYFFKNGSVISIDINSLLIKPAPPTLFFSLLKTSKGTYKIRDELELSFAESRSISISFSTLSFNAKDISYQYSVSNGKQDNWRDLIGDINLAHPNFGNYTIKIKAKSISSGYCIPIVFTLHISKPFWATWWFIIASNLLTFTLIWIAIRYILNRREKYHKEKIKFLKSEYKALNALMNPHFIFNTLNSVQGLVNDNDKRSANEYLRIFSDLIRQNMHNVSSEFIPLQREIDLLQNYLKLEKLRFKEFLNYSIEIDESVDTESVMIPPLLIQPLVENSVKHGLMPRKSIDNFVRIRIYEEKEWLHIIVSDNGIGIDHSLKKANSGHKSFGLENIKKRIEQLTMMHDKNISFRIEESYDPLGNTNGTLAVISMHTD